MQPLLIPWFKLEPWSVPLPLVGDIAIQPFGVLAVIAIWVGMHFAKLRATQLNLPDQALSDFVTWTTGVGLISAYVLNALMYHPQELLAALADPPKLVARYWGLSSYGGFIGGTVAAVILCRRRGWPLSPFADVWCFGIPFAWFFARMGCFVVHDHPGVQSDFFLAVDNYDGQGVARHDLGFYEVLWAAAVAPYFWLLARRPRRVGFFVTAVVLAYAPLRFCMDFLRVPDLQGGDSRYLALTPAQYFSALLTILCLARIAHRIPRPPPKDRLHSASASVANTRCGLQ